VKINDIDKIISRISYDKRARVCEDKSRDRLKFMEPLKFFDVDGKKEAYNYELELLSFRSAIGLETKIDYYEEMEWYHKCIKLIRSQDYLQDFIDERGADDTIAALGFMQFSGQQTYAFLFYRYNYMFNFINENIDMKSVFNERFNVSYEDFEAFVFVSQLWASLKERYPFAIIKNILSEQMLKVLAILTLSREQLRAKYMEITSNDEIYSFFDLNLLIKTPFIINDSKIFCFYAPFIPYACTQSLMFDITENNNYLRDLIGKNVIESYVYHIVLASKVTNIYKVLQEFEFDYKSNVNKTSDVVIYSDEDILFIEVKFFNQGLRLRKFDKDGISTASRRVSEGIQQLYLTIHKMRDKAMNEVIRGANNLNPFGFLLTYDEYYFSRKDAYVNAFQVLKDRGYELTYEDLINIVRLIPLSSFESILYHSSDDIFTYCRHLFSDNKNWDDKFYSAFNNVDEISIMPEVDILLNERKLKFKENLSSYLNRKI